MTLFTFVPEAINYIKYLSVFGKAGQEAELSAARTAVLADIGDDNTKKDMFIKDLVRMALDRKLTGTAFDSVFSMLKAEFGLCGLNSRANFSDLSWFFEFYIRERQAELAGYTGDAMRVMTEFYEHMTVLPDSVYKVNIYLFFLNSALNLQAVGQLSDEVDAALYYLSAYDLTDEVLQEELAGVFQLTPYIAQKA